MWEPTYGSNGPEYEWTKAMSRLTKVRLHLDRQFKGVKRNDNASHTVQK